MMMVIVPMILIVTALMFSKQREIGREISFFYGAFRLESVSFSVISVGTVRSTASSEGG